MPRSLCRYSANSHSLWEGLRACLLEVFDCEVGKLAEILTDVAVEVVFYVCMLVDAWLELLLLWIVFGATWRCRSQADTDVMWVIVEVDMFGIVYR
eukprot:589332-Amphidinium_carterae.2